MPLHPSQGASAYIHDFVHSKNPKFKGKSKKKRIQMALGAFYGAKSFHGKSYNPITDSIILETLGEIFFLEKDVPQLDFKVHPMDYKKGRVETTVNGVRYHHFPKEGMDPVDYYNRITSIYALDPQKALDYMKNNSKLHRRLSPEQPKLSDVGY